MEALVALLADDAVLTGDGGGQAAALPRPLVGAERIAHALRAFFRQGERMGAVAERVELGGQPGWLARAGDGTVLAAMALVSRRRARGGDQLGGQPGQAGPPAAGRVVVIPYS